MGVPISLFVEFHDRQLGKLPIYSRLQVIFAGIYHNIALCFISYILLFALPALMSIGYENSNQMLMVVRNDSLNKHHLDFRDGKQNDFCLRGDLIYQMNLRPMSSGITSWQQTLQSSDRLGVCVYRQALGKIAAVQNCCQEATYQGTCCLIANHRYDDQTHVMMLLI